MEISYIKPKYDINLLENYAKIIYDNKEYIFDINDFLLILNFDKNFNFYTKDDIYPSFKRHNYNITFLEFLYKFPVNTIIYNFKNNNKYDLRYSNVEIFHNYHKNIIQKFPNAVYYEGHFNNFGKDAYIMKNPYWEIENNNNNKIYLMYCEIDTLIKIDDIALKKLEEFKKEKNININLTFYKHTNGYILCSNQNLFIHQIITECYGNGKGTKNISVDHIDQNPLNNCFNNLRISTREEQEQNSNGIKEGTKRNRKHNARDLPEGITQDMLKKYVVYYKECLDKEKDLWREFFKVEKHPKLDNIWTSSKSGKISILDKLKQANQIVEDLDNDTYEKKEKGLPTYYTMNKAKTHLIYDRKLDNGERENIKMKLPDEYDLEEQITIIQTKVREKYVNNE